MVLPDELERKLEADLAAIEEENKMPYITGFERRAIEKGLSQGQIEGMRDAVQAVLEVRFGGIDQQTLLELQALTDRSALQAARAAVQTVDSVESLRDIWRQAANS